MALSVSPAVKVFALLSVVVAVVVGGGMFMLGGQETASAPLADPSELIRKKNAAAGKETRGVAGVASKSRASSEAGASSNEATRAAETGAKAQPKQGSAPATLAAKARAKPVPRIAKNGLPYAVARALRTNDVVVVALYGEDWKIDQLARDEAAAGARFARAGFVALDVTTASSAADALVLKYDTVFRAPAVLVFRRGGELALQLDGFRDRDTVAQAATNARS
jgi:hypothetical protein